MGIVHKNANFHGSENDFLQIKKKIVRREKKSGGKKQNRDQYF